MPLELQKAAVALVFAVFFLFLNIKAGETWITLPTFALMVVSIVVAGYFAVTWMW